MSYEMVAFNSPLRCDRAYSIQWIGCNLICTWIFTSHENSMSWPHKRLPPKSVACQFMHQKLKKKKKKNSTHFWWRQRKSMNWCDRLSTHLLTSRWNALTSSSSFWCCQITHICECMTLQFAVTFEDEYVCVHLGQSVCWLRNRLHVV